MAYIEEKQRQRPGGACLKSQHLDARLEGWEPQFVLGDKGACTASMRPEDGSPQQWGVRNTGNCLDFRIGLAKVKTPLDE